MHAPSGHPAGYAQYALARKQKESRHDTPLNVPLAGLRNKILLDFRKSDDSLKTGISPAGQVNRTTPAGLFAALFRSGSECSFSGHDLARGMESWEGPFYWVCAGRWQAPDPRFSPRPSCFRCAAFASGIFLPLARQSVNLPRAGNLEQLSSNFTGRTRRTAQRKLQALDGESLASVGTPTVGLYQ